MVACKKRRMLMFRRLAASQRSPTFANRIDIRWRVMMAATTLHGTEQRFAMHVRWKRYISHLRRLHDRHLLASTQAGAVTKGGDGAFGRRIGQYKPGFFETTCFRQA
jgi:hypothetical protein